MICRIFCFRAEDGIRVGHVTGVQTCALPILVSATYVALANFHSELIPPSLLLEIAGSRDKVPFPLFLELVLMEFAFELIREAGIRTPNPLGSTISIRSEERRVGKECKTQ